MYKEKYITLTFPPNSTEITLNLVNNEEINYNQINIEEFNITLAGAGPFPSKLDLCATEALFNQNISVTNGPTHHYNSVPLILSSPTPNGANTTFSKQYPQPFIVSRNDSRFGSRLSNNIVFYLRGSDNLPFANTDYPGNSVSPNRAQFAGESSIRLRLYTIPSVGFDGSNPKMSIPSSFH